MITFYLIGYGICFLAILVFGTISLAEDDRRSLWDVLLAILIIPFFSWILIAICVIYVLAMRFNRKGMK